MTLRECFIAYNPRTDEIMVGPWPDTTGWSDRYRYSWGGGDAEVWHAETRRELAQLLFVNVLQIIIRDKVPPMVVHRALLAVDEYRDFLSEDTPGVVLPIRD